MGSVAGKLFPKGASERRYWRHYSEYHSESGLAEARRNSPNTCKHWLELKLAEREGFEPTVLFRYSRFPGVRFKPLSHLSA